MKLYMPYPENSILRHRITALTICMAMTLCFASSAADGEKVDQLRLKAKQNDPEAQLNWQTSIFMGRGVLRIIRWRFTGIAKPPDGTVPMLNTIWRCVSNTGLESNAASIVLLNGIQRPPQTAPSQPNTAGQCVIIAAFGRSEKVRIKLRLSLKIIVVPVKS